MDILNKKKVGGRGRQTDYVFHFHFALCLNKQLLTALFSKPTFSQLLSGTTERENNTQDVQDYLTLHTCFTQQSVVWLHKSQGELLGVRRRMASRQISTGTVHSDPHSVPGGSSTLPSFCDRSQFCHRNWSAAFHWSTTAQKLRGWLWTTA